MPRTALSVQETTRDGLTASYTAASTANGHEFANSTENVFLHVKNAGVGTTVITIATSKTIDGLSVADRTVSVLASTEQFIGPFANADYGQGGTTVYVDLDVDTSVTMAAIKIGSQRST